MDDMVNLDVDDVQLIDENATVQGKLVALSLGSGTDIAAYGTIVKAYGPNELIHGIPLPEKCIRVSIDEAIDENADLPIPTTECESIGDAVGSHVAWPVHLLKLRDEKPKKKKKLEKSKPMMDFSTISAPLRMVYCYCKASLEREGCVMISLDEGVFGKERTLYVHFEDVEAFCKLQSISYMCIAVYIWHLYNKIGSSSMLQRFKFVDPYNIGHIPYTRKDKKTLSDGMEQRARHLANGLNGTLVNQLVLVPCNVGAHWILTIIDPHKEEVGMLDPLYNGIRDGVWKQVVELALKMFSAENGCKGRKKPTWIVVKGPKQPDAFQCGYYVMKYMKQVVECDTTLEIRSLHTLFTGDNYTDMDINEVRKEWAERVQEHIYDF